MTSQSKCEEKMIQSPPNGSTVYIKHPRFPKGKTGLRTIMSHSFHFSLKYSGQVQNGINHVKGFNRLLIMRVLWNITCTCNFIFCLYSCICHFINHRLRFSVSFFYIPTLAEIQYGRIMKL